MIKKKPPEQIARAAIIFVRILLLGDTCLKTDLE